MDSCTHISGILVPMCDVVLPAPEVCDIHPAVPVLATQEVFRAPGRASHVQLPIVANP